MSDFLAANACACIYGYLTYTYQVYYTDLGEDKCYEKWEGLTHNDCLSGNTGLEVDWINTDGDWFI